MNKISHDGGYGRKARKKDFRHCAEIRASIRDDRYTKEIKNADIEK